MLQKKLATKITVVVMVILLSLVVILISGANWITKTHYQDHVEREISVRAAAHANFIEQHSDDLAIDYIEEIEEGKNSVFIILDSDLSAISQSANVSGELWNLITDWLIENRESIERLENEPFIDHVDTYIVHHIPHVWAIMPISDSATDEVRGYIFLDQDTGDINQARIKLVILLFLMSIAAVGIGLLLTKYLTRKVSNPLNEISKMTEKIAEGDFDIKLNIRGKDEVSHLADSIQSMTRQLKVYRDSRRQFISHISHDLRTPITYIKGYSALMKESEQINHEEWKGNINVIYHEAKRMEKLVSDLFLLTKLDEGKIILEKELIPIDAWLKHIYQSRVLLFEQKSIKHSLDISGECKGLKVLFDPNRMEQALVNLLENAIRHTPVNGEINISLSKKHDQIVLSLKDTGEGIAEEDIVNIWDRFYKADKSRKQNENSATGLGLAIVKEIVELHDGSVSVASVKGEGAEFFLYLPVE
ncbi:sensor histidine kinase [Evansella halocellulosilytica]|uniref:sensor histidine kinase n=1 Tax=Evansella halocellulosilytica TaxID=2011013 RepID=UPI000BB9A79C|nr:sensor histidine kinase [Evansella halocellulosilytica]